MNFNLVRQAEGKMDGKYQAKITMYGVPNPIGAVQYNPKTGKPFQQVTITDDAGETNKVKILGGKMGDACIDRRLVFDIAPNPFEGKMYYQGFWNDRVAVAPAKVGVKASGSPQGAKSPAVQGQTTPQPDWDAKDLRIARMCALNNAVEKQVIMADISKDLNKVTSLKVIETAEEMLEWIYLPKETELEKQAGDLLNKPMEQSFEEQYNLDGEPPPIDSYE